LVIYATGLLTETIADYQKWTWKQTNPGKFCNAGLWSFSQHPNFFGNFLIWSGITVMNVPALIEPIHSDGTLVTKIASVLWAYRKAILAMLSPAFLWMFFNGQARGDIGSGVEESLKRYGNDAEFQEYIEKVPLFVPHWGKIFD
jgi:steroid 5-alpha reductase family enzyme